MVRTKTQADPAEIVVAIDAFASDTPEVGTIVPKGSRWRADHPVVKAHGGWFVPDGSSDLELSNERQARYEG